MEAITSGGPVLDSYMVEIPLRRVGEPEEIAAFVRFLIGPEAGWITGQNLSIDGGQTVRKGADYSDFSRARFASDPKWRLVEEGD
jgi:NAD(P)-dependent dehydrogenase (short-subunit alcohol dehydrogenase family)